MSSTGVLSTKCRAEVNGIPTDVFLSRYSDRLLCVITQTGTLGTMLHIKCVLRPDGNRDIVMEPLFGRRDHEEMLVCAKRLASMFYDQISDARPLVLSMAMKELCSEHIKKIVEIAQTEYGKLSVFFDADQT